MGVVPAAAAAALVCCAAIAAAAPAPLALKRIVATRQAERFTLRIELNQKWTNAALRADSGIQLRVLYDSTGDGRTDYVGRIAYQGGDLVETISGNGNQYEPVPVGRPSQTSLKFTHPVDVMFPTSKQGTLRITVVLDGGGKPGRVPRKGWFVVPAPPPPETSPPEALAVAAVPLVLKRIEPSRGHGRFTLQITLNRPWWSGLFPPRSRRQMTVLYDVTGDGKPDYTGRIVYRGSRLVEQIAGRAESDSRR